MNSRPPSEPQRTRGHAVSRVVVDTNVLGYLFRNSLEAPAYRALLTGRQGFVSMMSYAEMDYGVLKAGWGEHRQRALETFLGGYTEVPLTRKIARRFGQVRFESERNGRIIDTADTWIAATALELGLPLMTHNSDDFLGVTGLQVISVPGR
jgi:tRNA(fMet)-specific endonuclease VapC